MDTIRHEPGPCTRTRIRSIIASFSVCMLLAGIPIGAAPPDGKLLQESRAAIEKADPFMGDWQGTFTQRNKKTSPLVAQVVALGKGRYHATLLEAFDQRTTTVAGLEGQRNGDTVQFVGWGDVSVYRGPDWDGLIQDGKFTGSVPAREGGTFELKKVVRLSPTLGAQPPAGAVVLFDGKNLDEWESFKRLVPPKSPAAKGAKRKAGDSPSPAPQPPAAKPSPAKAARLVPVPVKWIIVDGNMSPTSGSGSVFTRKKFNCFKLHLEFRTPFDPEAREQARGNSGVKFHGLEIQVLDTYGLVGRSKECGGIYARVAPLVNACAPPVQWQTYDVTVEPSSGGDSTRLTVLQNGIKIHDGLDIGPIKQPTALELQDHRNPVQYRNVWLVELR